MKTEVISINAPQAIPRALEVLRKGGLVAFPTDTVYGVGALVNSYQGIDRLFAAKNREGSKAIAVLVGDPQQLELVAEEVTPLAALLAEHFWPGALTLVVPRRAGLPDNLSPLPTVGVRLPDHTFARMLLRATGPLATTSANLSGQPSPCTPEEVLAQLGGRIELLLDGGRTPGGMPSTVVDCTGAEPKVLREGPISVQKIREVLESRA